MTSIDLPEEHEEILRKVGSVADSLGQPVYVVGGYVRDLLLKGGGAGSRKNDIDFVTVGSGERLAREVAEALNVKQVSVFRKFGTAHIRKGEIDLEFVGARKESYNRESRKPLVEGGSLEDDQLRRDLTINAMSIALNEGHYGELLDPFGGLRDLDERVIRTPIDPHATFDDDPLRMLRAIRFAVQLHFDIAPATYAAIRDMHERIRIVSAERILDELNKMILAVRPSAAFAMLSETGLLAQILPEMMRLHGVRDVEGIRHKDNFWHTLQVLDNVADMGGSLWLRWAAILHDIAKPATQRFVKGTGWTFHGHDAVGAKWVPGIFRRLGLPLDERMRSVQNLVRLHLRPIALVSEEVTDSAVRRLLFDAGDDIDDLMMLCRADITSKNEVKVKRYLENFDLVESKIVEVEEKDRLRNWKNPVTGEMIMRTLGIGPGPEIGVLKDAVKEAILDGVIPNEPGRAEAFMLEEAARLGIGAGVGGRGVKAGSGNEAAEEGGSA
jgi:poly(A) polymerase